MSMPQRPLLPPNSAMDDKPRLGVLPFPFCGAAATSSPSSVFPPMFPGFQQVYNNFMQAQLLHLAQQQQQQQMMRSEVSPSLSDRGSSRSESPSTKS
ncbi:unnamed protein product [Caenorhabditis auriculariae]|uniref:Uncharacterized protein n=1 Tax=Caenorhabditis auriculariae TaxID=2777116 RepID=A0A8S1HB26_9PELO|nr:unnamed protein product [Caenorhabditis auriculariae]